MLKARRCLWPPDHEATRAALQKDLADAEEEDSIRWNRDFRKECTLDPNGDIQWIGVPAVEVPMLYRDKIVRPDVQKLDPHLGHSDSEMVDCQHVSENALSATKQGIDEQRGLKTPLKQTNCKT